MCCHIVWSVKEIKKVYSESFKNCHMFVLIVMAIDKLLLARDKFMPDIHRKQPRFTYSACGPFTQKSKKYKNLKKKGIGHMFIQMS